jgi:hypothetical protein
MRGGRLNQRTVLGVTAGALLLAGCGSGSDYANNPRPPSPITITAAISGQRVEVSPRRFGAGPITLVVTNQTQRLRDLVLESTSQPGSGRAGLAAQHTGPINPQGTASLKADLREGNYTVRVRAGNSIRPARLIVGHQRPSAQNQLLQP